MKVVIFVLFSLFMFCAAQASAVEPEKRHTPSVEAEGLKGKVKSVTIYDYSATGKPTDARKGKLTQKKVMTFNTHGYILSTAYFRPTGKEDGKFTYTYNTQDDETEMLHYKPDGTIDEKSTSTYDDKAGTVICVATDAEGVVGSKYLLGFDDKGNRTEYTVYNEDGSIMMKRAYSYDPHGNCIKEIWLEEGTNEIEKFTTSYNAADNPIVILKYENDTLRTKDTFIYNAKGQKTEERMYDQFGNLNYKYTLAYDDKGNVTDNNAEIYVEKGIDKRGSKYSRYDKYGNYLTETMTEDDKATKIIEREIEYEN